MNYLSLNLKNNGVIMSFTTMLKYIFVISCTSEKNQTITKDSWEQETSSRTTFKNTRLQKMQNTTTTYSYYLYNLKHCTERTKTDKIDLS